MPTKRVWLPNDIYQLKVTLRDTRPPIWRRLLVPAGLTLEVLHDVLQVAMGWDGSHLHDFRIGQKRFGKPDPNDRLMGLDPIGNERTTHLYRVLGKVGAKAMYTYALATVGSMRSWGRKCCRPNRGLPIRSAWAANFKVRPKTAGVSQVTTISWK